MKLKLINTNKYLLFIDEEAEIKENNWYENNGVLFLSDNSYDEGNNPNMRKLNNSIIAYYPLTKEAKELDLPLLPPFEEYKFQYSYQIVFDYVNSGIRNYEAMMELIELKKITQSKQFSLEDMKKAHFHGWFQRERYETQDKRTYSLPENWKDMDYEEKENWYFKQFIQTLSTQQLPKEFIPEYELIPVDINGNKITQAYFKNIGDSNNPRNNIETFKNHGMDKNPINVVKAFDKKVLKIITNPQGQKVVQGEYKFK